MAAIISVQHLSKEFKDTRAVDDLSFTVNDGDVYGFLGQNGAGKSTTIRMLLTLIKPTSGDIHLFGKQLRTHRSEILQQVGAVIEKPDLYKYLSAYDNLSIFAPHEWYESNPEIAHEPIAVGRVGRPCVEQGENFQPGNETAISIAVALVHNPALVILDEPTNGLDPQGIADIRSLILRLSREMGKTVLISSHLLSEIELVATRMIIIHKGRKIIEGDVADLLDPAHTLVQLDTTDNEKVQHYLASSRWARFVQRANGLDLMMNKEEVPELINELVANQVRILSVNSSHSLENYFLSLTTQPGHVDSFAN